MTYIKDVEGNNGRKGNDMIDYILRISSQHRAMIIASVEEAYWRVIDDGEPSAYVDLEGSNFPQFMAHRTVLVFDSIALHHADSMIRKDSNVAFGFDVHEGKFQFVRV